MAVASANGEHVAESAAPARKGKKGKKSKPSFVALADDDDLDDQAEVAESAGPAQGTLLSSHLNCCALDSVHTEVQGE